MPSMKKKSVYTNITPIPSHIPRQLAIDMLHSHREILELNPLVIGVNAIKPLRPRLLMNSSQHGMRFMKEYNTCRA